MGLKEVITHEGIMDAFKSKNIKTTERTLILIDNLNILQSYDDKNWCYEAEYFLENSETLKTNFDAFLNINKNKILDYNKYLNNFLNGSKKIIILNKDSNYKFKNLSFKSVFSELKKGLNSESKFNSIFNIIIKNNNKFLKVKKDNKDLLLQQELFKKVIELINKENEFTEQDITNESALNTESNKSVYSNVWFQQQDELKVLSQGFEHYSIESGSNFINNIKTYFTNALMGIMNSASNFFKSYSISDKYFKDNVNALNSKASIINTLASGKFSEIENIETKCVLGMNLNYVGTVKELKVFLTYVKNVKQDLDSLSDYIENLYNNVNDERLSNYNHSKFLSSVETNNNKTTTIISELIDGKSTKEDVKIGNLFPNSNSIKLVKEELIDINNQLIKLDIEAINKSVARLVASTNMYLKDASKEEGIYSKHVIITLQESIENVGSLITNLGSFLALSNQFTSYYLTTIDVIKDKK